MLQTHWLSCALCKLNWPHNANVCTLAKATDTCPLCDYRKEKSRP